MYSNLLDKLDGLIDSITMYRLVLYYLIILIVLASIFSGIGLIHYNALYVLLSGVIFVVACYIINKFFSYFFSAPSNPESSIITGLILTLIIAPESRKRNFSSVNMLAEPDKPKIIVAKTVPIKKTENINSR